MKGSSANLGQTGAKVKASTSVLSASPTQSPPPAVIAQKSLTPLDIFNTCLCRANNLLLIHKAAHGSQGKPEKYLSDAHRAAIVLAVSALDAFVRAFVIHRIRLLVVRQGTIPDSLANRIKTFLKEDGLLEAARRSDLQDRVEKAFQSDFEKRSFQGSKVIAEYMELAGLPKVFDTIAKKLNINEELLVQRLDKYTQRRHFIAHRGDFNLSDNPPSENPITKGDAEECIQLVRDVAREIDNLRSA